MTEATKGILAIIAACSVWGLAPICYKFRGHVPSGEMLAHRTIWTLMTFGGVLALRGRLGELAAVLRGPPQRGRVMLSVYSLSSLWRERAARRTSARVATSGTAR